MDEYSWIALVELLHKPMQNIHSPEFPKEQRHFIRNDTPNKPLFVLGMHELFTTHKVLFGHFQSSLLVCQAGNQVRPQQL